MEGSIFIDLAADRASARPRIFAPALELEGGWFLGGSGDSDLVLRHRDGAREINLTESPWDESPAAVLRPAPK